MQKDKPLKLAPKLLFHKLRRPKALSELEPATGKQLLMANFYGACLKIDHKLSLEANLHRIGESATKAKRSLEPIKVSRAALETPKLPSLEFTFGADRLPAIGSFSIESTPVRRYSELRPASVKENTRSLSAYRIK